MTSITHENQIISRLKLDRTFSSVDYVDEVVLSKFNNSINELLNGVIVNSHTFKESIRNASNLNTFLSYEPKFRYYVFMVGSKLMLLRSSKSGLVLKQTFSGVVNYDIEDYLSIGKPQLVVYKKGVQEPIVTDGNSEKIKQSTSKQIQSFVPLIHKSKLMIQNAEIVHSEKTRLLSKLSTILAFNCDSEAILSTKSRLVYLKQGVSALGLPTKRDVLSVGDPWMRTHSSQWVVGFPITNVSSFEMKSFEMYVSSEFIATEKMLMFKKTSSAEVDIYEIATSLFGGESGVLVCVFDEPWCVSNAFNSKFVCFENFDRKSWQCFLGVLRVECSHLVAGKFQLFSPIFSLQDLIAIQASYRCCILKYSLSGVTHSDLLVSLKTLFNSKCFDNRVLVNLNSSLAFYTNMIVIDSLFHQISIYGKSNSEILLMVKKCRESFRGTVTFNPSFSDVALTVQALRKEVTAVKGLAINELMENEGNQSTKHQELEKAQRDLMLLEINAAVSINDCKKSCNT